jgi:uncharacterized protein
MTPRPHRRVLALCAALALAWTGMPASAGAEPLRLATAGVTGIYHALGSALCRLLEPDLRERLERCVVLSTEGSLVNLELLRVGEADVGIAQGVLVKEAFTGAGIFAEAGPNPDLRVLFAPLQESLAVVVRAEDAVQRLEELSGRRIDLGPPGSGTQVTVMRLIEAAAIDPAAFLALASPTSALSADLLCGGGSNAFAFVGAHPNAIVQAALTGCATRLVPLDGPILDRFLETRTGYRLDQIGPSQYIQLDAPVTTVGTRAFAVVDAGLADEIAYRLTETVFAQLGELRRLHLSFAGLDQAALVEACPPAPYHPGALAYFAKAGIELPDCP